MSDDDVQPAYLVFAEAFGETPTQGQAAASLARTSWHRDLEGAETDEEVGRVLLRKYAAGPRMWAGRLILRELGLLVDGGEARH
jgi:hypothetical protein